MESLQKLLSQTVERLRGLTISQRLAILLGGVLVAVSLFWMARWAASPEMVPLLDQDFEATELAQVRSGLELMNEPFKLTGRQILVRPDSRQVVLAQLQQQNRMPGDTSTGFDALVQESNPWISQAEHERRWTVAFKHELERVLGQFAGVRSASVFLPMNSQKRRFTRHESPTSASVTLLMEGGQPVSRNLAIAAARLVAGAVRGLSLQSVEVLDGNGVSALDWESESTGISALDRMRHKHERDVRAKIIAQIPDPEVRVGVQVRLDLTDEKVEIETPSKPVETLSETTNETTTRARPSGQPGPQPNVGVVAGGRVADEHTERETTKSQLIPAIERKRTDTPSGGIKEIWAAINLSHSYLTAIYQRQNPEGGTPTEKDIKNVFDSEKPRIISQVTKLVTPQDEDHVAVEWYYDTAVNLGAPAEASTLDQTFQLVQRYGPQSGLALLAFLSLGLMLRMARRNDGGEAFGLELGLPKEAIAAAQQAAQDVATVSKRRPGSRGGKRAASSSGAEGGAEGYSAVVGEAAATEGVLVAQEVDEKTVQTYKMIEQVSQVIESDPEAGSALLEEWVRRTDSYGN
ncbi:MAG: hypothetical protein ABIG44_01590 [Planctomycetota bacterium]